MRKSLLYPFLLGTTTARQDPPRSIFTIGSLNVDTFLPLSRFPSPGETLTLLPTYEESYEVPGGKGLNQAVAVGQLSHSITSAFMGQLGNDAAADKLQNVLVANGVDISTCGRSNHPTGRGYVLWLPHTGEVSAILSGGSNQYGWDHFQTLSTTEIEDLVRPYALLLLQCEIPQFVNVRLAQTAKGLGIPVLLDVGGEDRPIRRDLLECCDYLMPNETELERLAATMEAVTTEENVLDLQPIQSQLGPEVDVSLICKRVYMLQKNGATNVLVTLGGKGSLLFQRDIKVPIYQAACALPSQSTIVDETGAGDCYRAAFAVSLMEMCTDSIPNVDVSDLRKCMKFASAAGACAVTKQGAVPSIPTRERVEELLQWNTNKENSETTVTMPRGGMMKSDDNALDDADVPFLFGSRLNSMKDRQDMLHPTDSILTPRDFVRRQAAIKGLGCVDFNYPQHFQGYWTPDEAKRALDQVGLVAGSVCLRYPSKFARGAMNHPDPAMRREAIEMTKEAAKVARILSCNEVIVWSAYDGYDYPFQVNYKEKWDQLVEAFRECCDAYPDIKWSLEYKPTDENTRFFTVPSTGAAVLLVNEVDRPNMGLTLDVGHMLMSGENPGQSIAMVGDKLFGIQLNDGYTRLAAEDGMMFGSIHPSMAMEVLYQLRVNNFRGHFYFDTFPQRTDPVREAEYNIQRVKEFWRAVEKMSADDIARITNEHDALGAMELVNEALRSS